MWLLNKISSDSSIFQLGTTVDRESLHRKPINDSSCRILIPNRLHYLITSRRNRGRSARPVIPLISSRTIALSPENSQKCAAKRLLKWEGRLSGHSNKLR